MEKKDKILSAAQFQVKKVTLSLEKAGKDTAISLQRSKEMFNKLSQADQIVESALMKYNKKESAKLSI